MKITIDSKKRRVDFMRKIVEVEQNSNLSYQQKDKRMNEIADTENRFMGGGFTPEYIAANQGAKPNKMALSSQKKQFSLLCSEVRKLNLLNSQFRKKINVAANKYPDFDFSDLDCDLPDLRAAWVVCKLRAESFHDEKLAVYLSEKVHIERNFYYRLRLRKDSLKAVNSATSKNNELKQQAGNVKKLSVDRINALLGSLQKSNHWVDLTIYLAIATGRRSIEILRVGGFEKVGNNTLLFSGQAKTRGGDNSAPYEIPCLDNADNVLKAFKSLRMALIPLFKGLDIDSDYLNDDINYLTNGRLNDNVSRYLDSKTYHYARDDKAARKASGIVKGDLKEFTLKDCRIIYSHRVLELFPSDETDPVYRKRILGHSDIFTQVVYEGIKLISSPEKIEKIITTKTFKKSEVLPLGFFEKFDSDILENRNATLLKIHSFVKTNSSEKITQSFLTRTNNPDKLKVGQKAGGGFGRPNVKKYFELLGL